MSYLAIDLRKTYSGDVLKPLSVMKKIMVKFLNLKETVSSKNEGNDLLDENKECREYYENAPRRGTKTKSISRELAARGNLW